MINIWSAVEPRRETFKLPTILREVSKAEMNQYLKKQNYKC